MINYFKSICTFLNWGVGVKTLELVKVIARPDITVEICLSLFVCENRKNDRYEIMFWIFYND